MTNVIFFTELSNQLKSIKRRLKTGYYYFYHFSIQIKSLVKNDLQDWYELVGNIWLSLLKSLIVHHF